MSLFEMQTKAAVIVLAVSMLLIFLCQAKKFATTSAIANFSANIFVILYLGFFASFVLSIRTDFGVWPLLMYIFTIKFSDIGAFTLGSMIGKHKLAPKISPGKTWEGMLGAVIFSAIISSLFAHFIGIMTVTQAVIFGVIFAFLGQFGDLVESMLKRDAQQKDSSNTVPGFGGVLDIIDSLLIAAPLGYVYFWFVL
jgi:phosphatidate cytidylyltransferase